MLRPLAHIDVSHHHGEVTTRRGSASAVIVAPADAVFEVVTDPSRMTLWNAVMTEVVEVPEAMAPGSEWVVAFQASRVMRWRSRSRCEALVQSDRTFVHRSGTDDGNPSYAIWTWTVEPEGKGRSTLRVTWELHPETVLRKVLLSRIRNRMLRSEVPASLSALNTLLVPRQS
ncbi:MAG: SRPBCC family protein [Actinobacteria bacterium]|nr:SRPBCC family protein [Actinomycetota bacterium]